MEWVNIKTNTDRPRYLTETEMNLMLSVIPEGYSADPEERELIRQAIVDDLKLRLNQKISPSAIQGITNALLKYYHSSRIDPGTDVGTHSAEANCQPPMQDTLNSHRTSGQAKKSGIHIYEELFYARQKRSYEYCTIHYKDKTLTYNQVLDTKKDIVGCVFYDFIQDLTYEKQGQFYVKKYDIEMFSMLSHKWWHRNDVYLKKLNVERPPDDAYVLRLYLNLKEMFRYKVTIQDLVDALKREKNALQIMYGSIHDGMIDIYVSVTYKTNKKGEQKIVVGQDNDTMISASYYQTIIIPNLKVLRIKGVAGITDLTPIIVPVASVIISDTEVSWLPQEVIGPLGLKLLEFMGMSIKNDLITMPHYDNTLNISKEDYLKLDPISYIKEILKDNLQYTQTSNLLKAFNELKPMKQVTTVLLSHKKMKYSGIDMNVIKRLFNQLNIEIIREGKVGLNTELLVVTPDVPRKLIASKKLDASVVIHAEAAGNNLRDLMSIPILEPSRLICNNIHVIAAVLGIRAARTYFIKELSELMSSFGIDPQHILTIANVLFSSGAPLSVQHLSANKKMGPLDRATVSKPVETFKSASMRGATHPVQGISTQIALGMTPRVGTGYMDIGLETESGDVYTFEKKKEQEVKTVLKGKKVETPWAAERPKSKYINK